MLGMLFYRFHSCLSIQKYQIPFESSPGPLLARHLFWRRAGVERAEPRGLLESLAHEGNGVATIHHDAAPLWNLSLSLE